jgi:hypothetical protein
MNSLVIEPIPKLDEKRRLGSHSWMRNAWVGLLVGGLLIGLGACGDDESGTPQGGAGGGGDDASTSGSGGDDASISGSGGSGAGNGGSGGSGGDDASADDSGEPDAGNVGRPHPLYPTLDLDALPGPGGAASGPYTPPALPETTRTVTASTSAEIAEACQTAGTHVMVPSSAGELGTLDLGNTEDCDIELEPDAVIQLLYLGHLPGPMVAPVHRVRVRGGQIGHVMVDPGSTDIVLDGVTINSGVMPAGARPGVAIYLLNQDTTGFVERFALVRSVIRMVATEPMGGGDRDGAAYLAGSARDVFFADNNIVTGGNRNSWGFRIGGGDNFIAVDNAVRVSFHKLIRMNDGPVDYVYVRGGLWMREATLTAGGDELNDAFAQLGDLGTDNVFIHDTAVYLLSDLPISFGASFGPGQADKSWEARRIAWHARSEAVVSDMHLMNLADGCVGTASCDYGIGTHSYDYEDGLTFPENPWRVLAGLAEDDPDAPPTR